MSASTTNPGRLAIQRAIGRTRVKTTIAALVMIAIGAAIAWSGKFPGYSWAGFSFLGLGGLILLGTLISSPAGRLLKALERNPRDIVQIESRHSRPDTFKVRFKDGRAVRLYVGKDRSAIIAYIKTVAPHCRDRSRE